MCQAADLATVVRCLCHGIAVVTQHLADLIKQVPAAVCDARHVLEDDQLGRLVGEGFHELNDEPGKGLWVWGRSVCRDDGIELLY